MRNVKALFVVLCAMFLAVVCHVPAYPDPIVCTDAYYEDNGECMPCPNRYDYNLDSGKTSISQCQVQCPAGTYVDQPDVSNIGAGYSRLEYLESTGSQYIDTGHKHGSTNIHGVIRIGTNVNITGNVNIMGNQSGNATSDSGYSVGWSPPANGKPGNLFKVWVQSSNNRLNGATPHYLNAGTIHDIEFGLTANKRWIKYDNQTFESTHAGRIVSNTNIHLFDNGVHQMNQNFKGLIYYIKIYEDEVLVHNYLPVRENAGQQRVGILDTITGEFYTNSSGTGAFNVGTDVTEPCAPVGAGYYAEASVVNQGEMGEKIPCPIGTYSDDPNATSLASCLACPADKYNETTAATACKNCPSGYTANTDLGKTAQNQCEIRCVAGKYVASARGSCSNVGAGYWAAESLIGYGSTGTRTACPAGTSATNGTSAASCTECTNATYSTGGTACLSCPTGYDYNTTSGKTSASQCQISCSGGTYVDTANATCTDAGAGYYAAASVTNYGSTGTRTACPAGTTTSITNADSVSDCEPCGDDEISVYTNNGATLTCIPAKFTLTTTNLNINENTEFKFNLSATGTFYVDCGTDGTLSGTGAVDNTITRGDTTNALYTCTYTTGGVKTIKFAGIATAYSTSNTVAAISFYTDATPELVGGIGGSLGAIFPTLGSTNGLQPRFYNTFYNCSNMTGTIPSGLFTGISGAPANYMFSQTFYGCSGLSGSIPTGLFGNISGAPATYMFANTFRGCSGLSGSIPSGLFGNISGAPAANMFYATFMGCSSLTGSIPSGLFGNLFGAPADYMFYYTFYGCSGLTGSIPTGLFGNLSGAPATSMFAYTFCNCSGLTGSIPSGLFGNLSGAPASYMFAYTFNGCSRLTGSIPSGLFGNLSGAPAAGMFAHTFNGCSGLIGSIPTGLFGNISGAPADNMFYSTFYGCSGLTGSIPSGLFGNISGAPAVSMFYRTFNGCRGLTGSIPSGLFGNLSGAPAGSMFSQTFSGCSGLTGSIPSGLFGNISGAPADSMFAYTFADCSGLTGSIPSGLFGNLSGAPAEYMFYRTFYDCSGLTGSIPTGLFGNISGAPASQMFMSTFYNCSNLSGSIPSGLFGNLSGAPASNMFALTFAGCSGLTGSIPSGLFGNISGAPASGMFYQTFTGCRSLTGSISSGLFGNLSGAPADNMFAYTFLYCAGLSGYVPKDIFENITSDNIGNSTFAGTNLYTTCPCGTKPAATGWGATKVNTRAICEVGTKTNEHWDNGTCTTDCTLGVTRLKSSTGLDYPLLSDPTGVHNIYFGYNNGVCHVPLVSGAANNAINVSFNGETYNASQPDEIMPTGFTGQPASAILGN